MKTTDAQKQGVAQWAEKWRPRLLLNDYAIEMFWHQKPHKGDGEAETTNARVHFGHAGLEADLHIYPAFWGLTPRLQEKTLLHELTHVVAGAALEGEINSLTEILWRAFEERA